MSLSLRWVTYLGLSLGDKASAQHVDGVDDEGGDAATDTAAKGVIDGAPFRGGQLLWQDVPHSLRQHFKRCVLQQGERVVM